MPGTLLLVKRESMARGPQEDFNCVKPQWIYYNLTLKETKHKDIYIFEYLLLSLKPNGYFSDDYGGWHFEKYLNLSPLEADLR